MRSAPPEVVAAWPKPNYVDPESQGPDLIVAGIFTLVVALIALGLRMYVRLVMQRKTAADDWVMVVATVCSVHIVFFPVSHRSSVAALLLQLLTSRSDDS